jgi:regulator of protease activity HflC (stomatin/prohibitin superfamily)
VQLAQATLRSCIGRIDLDKTFEEREQINIMVAQALATFECVKKG